MKNPKHTTSRQQYEPAPSAKLSKNDSINQKNLQQLTKKLLRK